MGQCPMTINGQHDFHWLDVPAREHNGQEVSPAYQRGFCWHCDQRETR